MVSFVMYAIFIGVPALIFLSVIGATIKLFKVSKIIDRAYLNSKKK